MSKINSLRFAQIWRTCAPLLLTVPALLIGTTVARAETSTNADDLKQIARPLPAASQAEELPAVTPTIEIPTLGPRNYGPVTPAVQLDLAPLSDNSNDNAEQVAVVYGRRYYGGGYYGGGVHFSYYAPSYYRPYVYRYPYSNYYRPWYYAYPYHYNYYGYYVPNYVSRYYYSPYGAYYSPYYVAPPVYGGYYYW